MQNGTTTLRRHLLLVLGRHVTARLADVPLFAHRLLVAPHKFAFAGKADMLTPTPRRLMRQLLLPKDFPPCRKYDPVQWGFNCRTPKTAGTPGTLEAALENVR